MKEKNGTQEVRTCNGCYHKRTNPYTNETWCERRREEFNTLFKFCEEFVGVPVKLD